MGGAEIQSKRNIENKNLISTAAYAETVKSTRRTIAIINNINLDNLKKKHKRKRIIPHARYSSTF